MKRLLVLLPLLLTAACSALTSRADSAARSAVPISDAGRSNLLELAYSGVSMMPLDPHIKNRSRAQQHIVDTCLELGLQELAGRYVEQIENWQRWMGYANLARYYLDHGEPEKARSILNRLEPVLVTAREYRAGTVVAVSDSPLISSLDGWRYKQVNAAVYGIALQLNHPTFVQTGEEDFSPEALASLSAEQTVISADDLEAAMAVLQQLGASQNFEIIHPALLGMVRLVDRYYEQLAIASWMDRELVPFFKKTPVFVRLDVLEHLYDVVLDHDDPALALQICDRMDAYIDAASLPLHLLIPERTRVLRLRCRAGDQAAAEAAIESLNKLYEDGRVRLLDIDRAALLCRLAELQLVCGRTEQAMATYQRAVEEGQVNPNSRPRADALSEICRSLALGGVEPPDVLWSALNEMKNSLGDPW